MLPPFDERGNLPPGVHWTTWEEFSARYGTNVHRMRLLAGLRDALKVLREVGCRTAYINGSFVTAKEQPNDYDVYWDATGVDVDRLFDLEPVFFDLEDGRASQKAKFLGEFFSDRVFLELYQRGRDGHRKGIVRLTLRGDEI